MKNILCLSQEDIRRSGAVDLNVAVPLVEETLKLADEKQTLIGGETALRCFEGRGDEAIYSLPAWIGGLCPVGGLKWSAHGPRSNADRGLPHICALDVLNDAATGLPVAVMDGALIGAIRTSAVTAVALKALAHPAAEIVLVCGTGAQAYRQLQAAAFAFPRAALRVWGRTFEHAQSLARRLRERHGLRIVPVEELDEAVEGADVLIAATSAREPYLKKAHFASVRLYCHIGLNEIEREAIDAFDAVVVDAWDEAKDCSGQSLFRMYRDGEFPEKRISGLLQEYVRGGKNAPHGKIFFDAFGLPIFDLALARHAWRYALDNGLGTAVPLWDDDYGADF